MSERISSVPSVVVVFWIRNCQNKVIEDLKDIILLNCLVKNLKVAPNFVDSNNTTQRLRRRLNSNVSRSASEKPETITSCRYSSFFNARGIKDKMKK